MSPRLERSYLSDGSFIDASIEEITADEWRPHGVRYRLAWIQGEVCRVLFDNHHGKGDHVHVDNREFPYQFISLAQLEQDFREEIRKLGGSA